jgi:hypothetical protein
MTSFKAWYFKAGESKVKLIDYVPSYKNTQALLQCDTIDSQTIHTDKGIFTIYFNDNGRWEDKVFNKPASQVLGKLPIQWANMNGNYIVECSTSAVDDEDYDYIPCDMPSIGFKEWIDLCSTVMRESQKRSAERYKAEGFKEVFNSGGFSVSVA